MAIKITSTYYAVNAIITVLVLSFLALRIFEILPMVANASMFGFVIVIIFTALVMAFTHPTVTIGLWVRRLGLVIMVLIHLKSEMDGNLGKFVQYADLTGSLVVVTDVTTSVGRTTAVNFAKLNATVVIGCNPVESCNYILADYSEKKTESKGDIIPLHLDLYDLHSVEKFSKEVTKRYPNIDVLINSAEAFPSPGIRTRQGIEASIGVMYLSQFALSKWLFKALQKPSDSSSLKSSKIITFASIAHITGSFDQTLLIGTGSGDFQGEKVDNCGDFYSVGFFRFSCCPLLWCPATNGYARAMLANVLHASELQRRYDFIEGNMGKESANRRVVSVALNYGTVLQSAPRAVQGLFRTPEEAVHVIMHAVFDDDFLPGSFIDSMNFGYDITDYAERSLSNHLAAFPWASRLPFRLPLAVKSAALYKLLWSMFPKVRSNDVTSYETLAARLYDVSNQIIADFEANRVFFTSPVLSSSNHI